MKKASQGIIIIRAGHQHDAAFLWFYRSPQGDYFAGSMDDIVLPKKLFRENKVIFLMPSSRLLFCDIAAANLKKPSLQALIWQIESELLSEAESLHGVILGRDNGQYSVAAVEKQLFARWLERLRQAGITPDAVYPDVLALPCHAAIKLGEEWLVRYGPTKGLCASETYLALLWDKTENTAPVRCFSAPVPAIAGWEAAHVCTASVLFDTPLLPEHSFLTSEFQPKPALTRLAGFKALIIGSAVSALLLAGLPFFEAYSAMRQAGQLENQARQQAGSHFSSLPERVPLRAWLEQKLSRSSPASSYGLHAMLEKSYPLLAQIHQGQTEALTWDSEQQTLTFTLADTQPDLPGLASGYAVEGLLVQAAPQKRKRVRLIIRRVNDEG